MPVVAGDQAATGLDASTAGLVGDYMLPVYSAMKGAVHSFTVVLAKEDARAQTGIVYDSSAVEGGWETLSQEEIEQRLNDKVQAGMINISCNTAPYFKDGKSEGNVMLVNELNNLYPQKVEFYRNDTGEKIYESKAIAVGSKIERAKLDVELPAGEYECTAYFSNLDPDSGATLGVAGAIIHITIQN